VASGSVVALHPERRVALVDAEVGPVAELREVLRLDRRGEAREQVVVARDGDLVEHCGLGGDPVGPHLVDHGFFDLGGAGHLELVDIQGFEHVALDLRRLPRAAVPVPLTEGVAGGVHLDPEVTLDHAWVQKVVGAKVDGKIGTGTVKLIKAYQKKHGLEADGIVGPGTKKVMQGKGEAPASPKEPDAVVIPSEDGGFTYTYLREEWDTQGISEGVHPYDARVKGIYLHWPASTGKMIGASAESI